MLNNEINEDFAHTDEEMPPHAGRASEWIITTESRVKNLAMRAGEWVKAHPKMVIGALLGVGAIGGGVAFFVTRHRRTSALAEIAAAFKRYA